MSGKPQGGASVQERALARYREIIATAPGTPKRKAAEIIRRELGKNAPKIQSIIRYLADEKVVATTGYEVIKAPEPRVPASEVWDAAKVRNERAILRAATRGKATIAIWDNTWFGIAFTGDPHLDSSHADLYAIESLADCVTRTEGLYVADGGDARDNFILRVLMSAQLESQHPPEEAMEMVDHYLSLFGGKMLWMVAGNHDAWERAATGLDSLGKLARGKGILYDSDQFEITLKCDGYDYKIFSRHRWRMNSHLNPAHAHKQIIRTGLPSQAPDVVALHHLHAPALEIWEWYGLPRILLRPGSAKQYDDFAHRVGFKESAFQAPVVLFNPKRREMIPFSDYELAARVLTSLREG